MSRANRPAHFVCLVLGILALHRVSAVDGDGTLRVEIRDKATGALTPAMVCITSLADGKWRTPPDGRVDSGYTTVRDFYKPFDWKPGDIGPLRLTNGEYKNNNTRASMYEGQPAYPYWKEPAAFFVTGPSASRCPPGAGVWRSPKASNSCRTSRSSRFPPDRNACAASSWPVGPTCPGRAGTRATIMSTIRA